MNRRIVLLIISIVAVGSLSAAVAPAIAPGQTVAPEIAPRQTGLRPFSGDASVEVQGPIIEAPPNRQWIVTIATMIITGVAAPILINQFKSQAERSGQNLTYAWDNAGKTQQLLIEANEKSIGRLVEELEHLRAQVLMLETRNNELHEQTIRAEMKGLEYLKRLAAYEPVTAEVPRKRSADIE